VTPPKQGRSGKSQLQNRKGVVLAEKGEGLWQEKRSKKNNWSKAVGGAQTSSGSLCNRNRNVIVARELETHLLELQQPRKDINIAPHSKTTQDEGHQIACESKPQEEGHI
jgi:hypothetical protein